MSLILYRLHSIFIMYVFSVYMIMWVLVLVYIVYLASLVSKRLYIQMRYRLSVCYTLYCVTYKTFYIGPQDSRTFHRAHALFMILGLYIGL